MQAPANRAVRPAMIPWIIALALSLATGSFAPVHPSGDQHDPSGKTMLSELGEDAQWSGRASATPVKLPALSWAAAEPPRPLASRLGVGHGSERQVRTSLHSPVRGRAPPAPSAS